MKIKIKKSLVDKSFIDKSSVDKSSVDKSFIDKQNRNNREFIEIPSFIFRDRSVAVLESLVEYLHDNKKFSFHEIAILLNRDDRTIWTVYNRVKKKRKK